MFPGLGWFLHCQLRDDCDWTWTGRGVHAPVPPVGSVAAGALAGEALMTHKQAVQAYVGTQLTEQSAVTGGSRSGQSTH